MALSKRRSTGPSRFPSYMQNFRQNKGLLEAVCTIMHEESVLVDGEEYLRTTFENSISKIDSRTVYRTCNLRNTLYLGFRSQMSIAGNERDAPPIVKSFWDSYDFSTPDWLHNIVYADQGSKILQNQLQFHPEANIDAICARLFNNNGQLKVYGLRIEMCVFDQVMDFIILHKDECHLFRYSCMCDRNTVPTAHFLLVTTIQAHFEDLIDMEPCSILNELYALAEEKARRNVETSFWPPRHDHFVALEMYSNWDVFCEIDSMCNRDRLDKPSWKEPCNKITSPTSTASEEFESRLTSFIDKLSYRQKIGGQHYCIMRNIVQHSHIWFSALCSEGIDLYVKYMGRRSIIPICHLVFGNRKPSLFVGDLDLRACAVPLKHGQYIYHSECIDGENRGDYDRNSFLYLGRNRYIYLSTASERCCNSYVPEIITESISLLTYRLNRQQLDEYKSFLFWTHEAAVEIEKKNKRLEQLESELVDREIDDQIDELMKEIQSDNK